MESELKPCPFCGGKAGQYPEDFGPFVMCSEASCACNTGNCGDAESAVKKWNTRALDREMLKRFRDYFLDHYEDDCSSDAQIDKFLKSEAGEVKG